MKAKKNRECFQLGCLLFFAVIFFAQIAHATTYYVRTDGNNGNTGTIDSPAGAWLTIDHAASTVTAGDTVYVHAGTYNERVNIDRSGSTGSWINYVAYPGETVIMRGFDLSSKSYIRIIGFEITHNSTAYSRAIVLYGTCTYIEILDNYIHNINGEGGAVRWWNQNCSYVTVRGNEFFLISCPTGGPCTGNGWAIQFAGGHHNVVEYNEAHRVGDFMNLHGHHDIVRNNYLYDFSDNYFSVSLHADMFQPTGLSIAPSQYHVYEANFMGDNVEQNSHVLQMRGGIVTDSDDHDILFRFNVAYNHGSYGLQAGGVDNVRYINNTLVDLNTWKTNGLTILRFNPEGGDPSINNSAFNNIFYNTYVSSTLISVESGCSATVSNNLGYNTNATAGGGLVSTSDPLFVNYSSKDFHIRSGSPARNTGRAITTVTSPNGSGTRFDVADAGFFCDGYGIVEGDMIKVGSNTPVRINNISGNTITVSSSVSWSNNDGVYYGHQDTTPDIGAYEYMSTSNLTATYAVAGNTVTVTPNDSALVRQVIVYENGIPVGADYDPPYSISGISGGSLHVRVYPLFASSTLYVAATLSEVVPSSPPPPDNLKVSPTPGG
ncbi:MAG TPA: hypothetical protein PKZ42_10310 [Syntrophales bacterium]|nr:hypothetical protein [Syntrophales bacterium]